MTTLLFTDDAFVDHRTPEGHPERPERMEAVRRALADARFSGLDRREAPTGDEAALRLVHPQAFIDGVRDARPAVGLAQIDADTWMSPGSWEAAMRAVGGACAAVDAIVAGEGENAFVASRPPGHHAERETAMGFCLFSTVAIAARHAQARHGIARVAIVDFDVHHGNGTQDVFFDDPSVLYASSHQMPLYPGTGDPGETGAGNILNVALPPGSGGEAMREAYERAILPRLDAFAPELILVSAGFDAHVRDPLAQLEWTAADFARVTRSVKTVAEAHCGGRLVSLLEGGYDLRGLAEGVAAHVDVLQTP